MTLSADEIEIVDYLKSWHGRFVSLVEVCRCAGGRRKFMENQSWASPLMARLVESGIVVVNDRGHYCVMENEDYFPDADSCPVPPPEEPGVVVEDNYFPAPQEEEEVAGIPGKFVSPEVAKILNRWKKEG